MALQLQMQQNPSAGRVRAGEVRSLKFKTRFSEVEMYRKFLWYLLRERTFDPAAVEDTMHLKNALALSDRQVFPPPPPPGPSSRPVPFCPLPPPWEALPVDVRSMRSR